MADVYATIADADAATTERLADVLELRAADPQQQAMLAQYTEDLGLGEGDRVLEVGCGTGAVSRFIARVPGVAEVVGVDPCELFVERARELADHPALTFAAGDGRDLDLEDASFDAIVFHTTLCHVPEPERALAQANRMLRTDGRLAIFDGDYVAITVAIGEGDPLQACADAAVRTRVHDPWLVRRLSSLLRDAGFEEGRVRGFAYTQTSPADYMLTLIDRGAMALVAEGKLKSSTADALMAEARSRVEAGTFFGRIPYASTVTRRS